MISEKCITLNNRITDPAETVPPGQMFVYMKNKQLMSKDELQVVRSYNDIQIKSLKTSNQTNNTVTMSSIQDLELSCVAGKTYHLNISVIYSSSNTGNGVGLTLLIPSGQVIARASTVITTDGTSSLFTGLITSSGDSVTSTSVPAQNTLLIAEITGIFACTYSGILVPQFRSENAGQTITVYQNSVAIYTPF